METHVHNDLLVNGSVLFGANLTDFPVNPRPGEMILKNDRHYAYTMLSPGYYSWLPISIKQSSYIHSQGVANATWTIGHNLNTVEYGLFVYDSNHRLIVANHTPINDNTISVTLTEPITGTAVVFAVTDFAATNFAATNLRLGNSILSTDNGTLLIDGAAIQSGGGTVTLNQSSIITALTYTPEDANKKNANNGYAGLNSSGKLPFARLDDFPLGFVSTELGYVPEDINNRNVNNGYAGLDASGKVPLSRIETIVFPVTKVANRTGDVTLTVSDIQSVPYDLAATLSGKPVGNESLFRMKSPRIFTVSAIAAYCVTNATGTMVFTVAKNGTSIGTLTFNSASAVAVSTVTSTRFVIGDSLTITAPAIPDATLSDIDISVIATLG